jgi:hypothetical protein
MTLNSWSFISHRAGGAVKLLKLEWREQMSAIASHLYEDAFANKITISAHSW